MTAEELARALRADDLRLSVAYDGAWHATVRSARPVLGLSDSWAEAPTLEQAVCAAIDMWRMSVRRRAEELAQSMLDVDGIPHIPWSVDEILDHATEVGLACDVRDADLVRAAYDRLARTALEQAEPMPDGPDPDEQRDVRLDREADERGEPWDE